MIYSLSAITNLTLSDLDGAFILSGTTVELLEPGGAYTSDELRGSNILESAITGGTAILFGPNNIVLSTIKNTGTGTIVGSDSNNLILNSVKASSLSGDTIYSGGTDLYDIFAKIGTSISGSGTDNTIPLWNGASSLDDSIITQQLATGVTVSGELKVSDKIGIGTTAPNEKLHIFGSGTIRAHIKSSGNFS